jgi:DNA-binding NtrC family response regulator
MERIIIVDDELAVGRLFFQILRKDGYICTLCNGPEKIFEVANPLDFDVLLTDYVMPGMNGAELGLAFLKINPNLRVIICSGYSDDFGPAQVQKNGFHGYLTKPMPKLKLLQEINRVIAL